MSDTEWGKRDPRGDCQHPIEHLLYFSGVLFHWIIPSHHFHFGSFHDGSPEAQAQMEAWRATARKKKVPGTSEPGAIPPATGT